MNVLQVLPELNVGGVETGTVDLAKHLIRLGHRAVVVSAGGPLVEELISYGAIHYQLPVHDKSFLTMLKVIPQLVAIINKEKIEIVHARSRVPAWVAYFACRKTKAVLITTCHGYYRRHPFSYAMGWAKRVIVLSNVIARHMIDDFGVPHERIRLVPRSVDLEKFSFLPPDKKRSDNFNVGIIGRLTPIKGHVYFIKAMARVAKTIPNLKIWIVGDAPASRWSYREELQILTKRLGLHSATQFLGTQRDIPAILGHLDLVVMATTTQEAFGRVIIEAQAAGVPVVATKVGGAIDIIDNGDNGLLVPPADVESMAEAVCRVWKDPQAASRMAQRALEKVKTHYTVELMVKNTLCVYDEALSRPEMLIIKLSALGDIILATAALRAISQKFRPRYRVSLLVSAECKDVVVNCPYIDELIICDLRDTDKGMIGLLRLGKELRRKNFDVVVDLQNNRASHVLAWLSWALERYGYDNKKFGFLLNHRIKDDRVSIDPVAHQFRVLSMLGIELKDPSLELWPTADDDASVEEFLASEWIRPTQKLIGINASSSVRWLTKNWPLRYMVRLCEELARLDMRLVITGTHSDAASAQGLVEAVKDVKPINACGKTTIHQLGCLIKRCSVYISSDSAPLHIAASYGVPFVALFGATDPRRHLPPAKDFVVIKKDLPCSPCYKSRCQKNACMESITPEDVLAAVKSLLP
jgi:lipopolysaccharide heptosyltransferase II